jgi:hypothetical protein
MNSSTKKELGCIFWAIVICIALGMLGIGINSILGDPSEHSIKGQLAPLITISFFIIILLVFGIIKIKK